MSEKVWVAVEYSYTDCILVKGNPEWIKQVVGTLRAAINQVNKDAGGDYPLDMFEEDMTHRLASILGVVHPEGFASGVNIATAYLKARIDKVRPCKMDFIMD